MAKKELLFSVTADDCRFEYFVGAGDGGQKKQKTKSACRCTHIASGAVGKATEDRMQLQNRKLAFQRMADTKEFKVWHKLETSRRMGEPSVESVVEEQLKYVKTEIKDEDGKWAKAEVSELKDE